MKDKDEGGAPDHLASLDPPSSLLIYNAAIDVAARDRLRDNEGIERWRVFGEGGERKWTYLDME